MRARGPAEAPSLCGTTDVQRSSLRYRSARPLCPQQDVSTGSRCRVNASPAYSASCALRPRHSCSPCSLRYGQGPHPHPHLYLHRSPGIRACWPLRGAGWPQAGGWGREGGQCGAESLPAIVLGRVRREQGCSRCTPLSCTCALRMPMRVRRASVWGWGVSKAEVLVGSGRGRREGATLARAWLFAPKQTRPPQTSQLLETPRGTSSPKVHHYCVLRLW